MWTFVRNDTRLIPGLLTAAVGLWLCWQGNEMPRPSGWNSSPGLFPVIIGAGLVIMAIALLIERHHLMKREAQAIIEPKHESLLEAKIEETLAEPPMDRAAIIRVVIITGIIGSYILILRILPFEVATALFLIVCMYAFGERNFLKIVSISVGVTAAIAFAFVYFLETLVPGNGSILDALLYG